MAITKTPVLIGIHPIYNLSVYRLFKYFRASRDEEIIQVFYDEYCLSNNAIVNLKENKYYIVKNLYVNEIANESIVTEEFLGFNNWFNYDIGVFPDGITLGQIVVGSINAALQGIPIDAPNGFNITSAI